MGFGSYDETEQRNEGFDEDLDDIETDRPDNEGEVSFEESTVDELLDTYDDVEEAADEDQD